MQLALVDIGVFLIFVAVVVAFSMYMSRREETSEDYFLAGRNLRWYLIGLSIVAANISTEQLVGMAGAGAGNVGLAVAGYQLLGSVTIVIVAMVLLPHFLRAGIYTMPEFLEYRYCPEARMIMAFYTMLVYVLVLTAGIIYAGALTIETIFDIPLYLAVLFVGLVATTYTTWGGLKAVVWADLLQGSALLLGGLLTAAIGLHACGGWQKFASLNADRLHMILPHDHPELPWTALLLGLWIPNFYYCGLNQFIVQRTLAAKSLREGQLGIIFAASLWLLVPFAIVMPGIMAVQLFPEAVAQQPDRAYPILIKHLIQPGLRGFLLAAIAGAVISTLASLLNSAATIFTMDLYKQHLNPNASQRQLVVIGRVATVLFVIIACLIAPLLGKRGVFAYIQEFQGYISPGILAAFAVGLIFPKAPPAAGIVALILNPIIYGLLHLLYLLEARLTLWLPVLTTESGVSVVVRPCDINFHDIAFLNRMAITFALIVLVLLWMTWRRPLEQAKKLPVREDFDMRPARSVLWLGGLVIAAVAAFFYVFR